MGDITITPELYALPTTIPPAVAQQGIATKRPPVTSSSQLSTTQKKRPRYSKSSGKRHGGSSYDKIPTTSSLAITTLKPYFPVYVGNQGIRLLAQTTFRSIQGKDQKLATSISESQLTYVLCVAYAHRLIQLGAEFGYAYSPDTGIIKDLGKGILLPDILAKYIEAIGLHRLTTGATIVPFTGSYTALFPIGHPYQISPESILAEAGRPIPDNPWRIDVQWILEYNADTGRASRSGMQFRHVRSELTGRVEMAVSTSAEEELIKPMAPETMSEAEAQLGACYQFRVASDPANWLGSNTEILWPSFVSRSIDIRVHYAEQCVSSFTGMKI